MREIDMNTEMTALIENIKTDYAEWMTGCAGNKEMGDFFVEPSNHFLIASIARFNEKITYKMGSKYIKVFSEGGGVWGFIVNTDNDKKFKKGDILKPAGYAAPARNKARGNIIDGGYTIRWTGPLYL
jgi:hypothetical protein